MILFIRLKQNKEVVRASYLSIAKDSNYHERLHYYVKTTVIKRCILPLRCAFGIPLARITWKHWQLSQGALFCTHTPSLSWSPLKRGPLKWTSISWQSNRVWLVRKHLVITHSKARSCSLPAPMEPFPPGRMTNQLVVLCLSRLGRVEQRFQPSYCRLHEIQPFARTQSRASCIARGKTSTLARES